MSNVQVASNIWINVDDPEGLGNNFNEASRRLPGDLGLRLIVGTWNRQSIDVAIWQGRLTKQQNEEYLAYKFFMPHTHGGDELVRPGL